MVAQGATFPHDVVVGTYTPIEIPIKMELPSGQRRDLRKALGKVTVTLAFPQIPSAQGLGIPAHGPVGDQPNSRCPSDKISIDWLFRRTSERNARSAVEKRPFSEWLCFLWQPREISQVNDIGARPRGHSAVICLDAVTEGGKHTQIRKKEKKRKI
ncbi:hypothetical protein BDV33DRAFT_39554 [Aspergillus novoparasiticus]|uniref:Uncharacterized protein n=1 Tax=Aspergillus novoparasiticus TaxID=986946 RepID=A0A5N6F0E8_9EURO|nr:hypothetical protein BDV33DRAFT_39554 [Aspergillus novoparasiticus]